MFLPCNEIIKLHTRPHKPHMEAFTHDLLHFWNQMFTSTETCTRENGRELLGWFEKVQSTSLCQQSPSCMGAVKRGYEWLANLELVLESLEEGAFEAASSGS